MMYISRPTGGEEIKFSFQNDNHCKLRSSDSHAGIEAIRFAHEFELFWTDDHDFVLEIHFTDNREVESRFAARYRTPAEVFDALQAFEPTGGLVGHDESAIDEIKRRYAERKDSFIRQITEWFAQCGWQKEGAGR